jgi:hypothetical protein
MPTISLSDLARMRIQGISFFLAGLLASAGLIQWIWNGLRKDFALLPRLTYGKALGVVVLWGLLFVLVLTMISGARELMTPGAWEKQGLTYRLAQPPEPPSDDGRLEQARKEKLEALRWALWEYARSHANAFPPDRSVSEIPAETWKSPDPSGLRYVYVAGLHAGQGASPLAYEPELFSPPRFVLLSNGEIRRIAPEQLALALGAEKP